MEVQVGKEMDRCLGRVIREAEDRETDSRAHYMISHQPSTLKERSDGNELRILFLNMQ